MLRRYLTLLLVGLMTILLAGCATYQDRKISPSDHAAALDQRRLDAPRLQEFLHASLPSDDALDSTPTWGLTTLVFAALYYQPALDMARAKLVTARAGVTTAAQRPNPTLDFSTAYDATSALAMPLTIGPLINFIVETSNKRGYRMDQTNHLLAAARWELATAGWQVRSQVRTALMNVWSTQRRLLLASQRLALQQRLVHLMDRRLAAGEVSSLDSTREHINQAQSALALQDLQRLLTEARVQLATAIGIPANALDGITLSFTTFDQPSPPLQKLVDGEWRELALTRRSDIQAKLDDYEATQSALQLQIAHQYPNLNLGPGYNYDLGDNKYLLNIGAELPIFNHNQGPIAEAAGRRAEAAASFVVLQAQIIGAIDYATAGYLGAMQSLTTADALLADAQQHAHQVDHAFQLGQADQPTVVTSELELVSIQLARLDAWVAQRQAEAALEDALEKPLFDAAHWPKATEHNPRVAIHTERSS